VIKGSIVGVAAHDADVGQDSTIRIEGVFELPKAAATALTFGQAVAWNGTAVGASGSPAIGVAAAPALAADTWPMCSWAITVEAA
jgi:predicted RecA/RadA family phage recombinase